MTRHLSLGVSAPGRTRRFYDMALGALGYLRLRADHSSLSYSTGKFDGYHLEAQCELTGTQK